MYPGKQDLYKKEEVMLSALVLSMYMFVSPLTFPEHGLSIVHDEKRIGWQPVVSEPFLDTKNKWCIYFVLMGETDGEGRIGYYDTIEVRGVVERVFIPFKAEEIGSKTRVAYYIDGESPELIKTSVRDGKVYVGVIYRLFPNGKIIPLYIAHGK